MWLIKPLPSLYPVWPCSTCSEKSLSLFGFCTYSILNHCKKTFERLQWTFVVWKDYITQLKLIIQVGNKLSIGVRFIYVKLYEWNCKFIHEEHNSTLGQVWRLKLSCVLYTGFSLVNYKLKSGTGSRLYSLSNGMFNCHLHCQIWK